MGAHLTDYSDVEIAAVNHLFPKTQSTSVNFTGSKLGKGGCKRDNMACQRPRL